ncbi:MAG: glutamine--fructose-6-phosphate aminotransferase [Gammaproteobacteria bacterium]|jgi:glucosamine--fructose-6-phosphate aminotransferase (isomerizing)|nr:glutamine--fructose-6-phosphate aminotransferase [Gammaproteobacteria bacterium]
MCGIVGAVTERNVVPILLEGLKRLEYRGYDSAGFAVIDEHHKIVRKRAVGKVAELASKASQEPCSGNIGIAHTRWATHGKPSERNAHPHMAGNKIAIVHNGIIENYAELKASLQAQGVEFSSDTDTEVVAHLIHQALETGKSLILAVRAVVSSLKGAYAIVAVNLDEPDRLIAVRSGSPLVIGLGIEENFIASDSLSLLPVTNRFIYLQEGDIAEVSRHLINITDLHGHAVTRPIEEQNINSDAASKGHYKHFMLKEIFEQPDVVTQTMNGCLDVDGQVQLNSFGLKASEILPEIENIKIVACGTSYHAGMLAKNWLEEWAGIPCDVEIASELRYRKTVVRPNTLFLAISQSGETADTLAALRQAKTLGYAASMAICNVPTSSLVRESDLVFMTRAGTEVGVASTKAFVTQLVALFLLTALLTRLRGNPELELHLTSALRQVPGLLQMALSLDGEIQLLANQFIEKHHALFLGRNCFYPLAMEGALKLKEISYIHAEAYPAGELKHGPLALVDSEMPMVILAPRNALLDKLKANIQEVEARGGQIFVVTEASLRNELPANAQVIGLPTIPEEIAPIVYTLPLQLLAYYVAVLKGTDVDQPRNLAKSVTVE